MKQLQLNKLKRFLILIPIFILSCTNGEKSISTSTIADSINLKSEIMNKEHDTPKNGIVNFSDDQKPKEFPITFRIIEGDRIIKTINGDMIPLTISDEFTTDQQKLILKIKNFKGKKIVGKISAKNANMNLRFNQIKFADGSFDGPFGREISVEIPKPGEIWLIIGKNLMADGKLTGKFSVSLQQ